MAAALHWERGCLKAWAHAGAREARMRSTPNACPAASYCDRASLVCVERPPAACLSYAPLGMMPNTSLPSKDRNDPRSISAACGTFLSGLWQSKFPALKEQRFLPPSRSPFSVPPGAALVESPVILQDFARQQLHKRFQGRSLKVCNSAPTDQASLSPVRPMSFIKIP